VCGCIVDYLFSHFDLRFSRKRHVLYSPLKKTFLNSAHYGDD
jgi:hypothetical protein